MDQGAQGLSGLIAYYFNDHERRRHMFKTINKTTFTCLVIMIFNVFTMISCDIVEDESIVTWDRAYAFDGQADRMQGDFVIETKDGGSLTSGAFGDVIAILKVDSSGNEEWSKVYSGKTDVIIPRITYSINETALGFLVAIIPHDESGVRLISLDTYGVETGAFFISTLSLNSISAICLTADNGLAIAGADNTQTIVEMFDNQGQMLWENTYSLSEYSQIQWIMQTSDLGFLISGSRDQQLLLTKLNQNGVAQWGRAINPPNTSFLGGPLLSLDETSDGGFFFSALMGDDQGFPAGTFTTKLSKKGYSTWKKEFLDIYIMGVKQTEDNGYVLAGNHAIFNGEYIGCYILKISKMYSEQWSSLFENNDLTPEIMAYDILETADGGFIVPGSKQSDYFVMKLNNVGHE